MTPQPPEPRAESAEREAFEEWALAEYPGRPSLTWDGEVPVLLNADGSVRCYISDAWDAWQAARSAPRPSGEAVALCPSHGVPEGTCWTHQRVERMAEEIRIAWVAWARTQPDPKASWLVPWADLDEVSRDADRAIARHLLAQTPPAAAPGALADLLRRARIEIRCLYVQAARTSCPANPADVPGPVGRVLVDIDRALAAPPAPASPGASRGEVVGVETIRREMRLLCAEAASEAVAEHYPAREEDGVRFVPQEAHDLAAKVSEIVLSGEDEDAALWCAIDAIFCRVIPDDYDIARDAFIAYWNGPGKDGWFGPHRAAGAWLSCWLDADLKGGNDLRDAVLAARSPEGRKKWREDLDAFLKALAAPHADGGEAAK